MPFPIRATYRVQLHSDFTLDDAAAISSYLAELGVSHLYCSPYLQAAPGSTHGYDIVNPRLVNRELGGEDALDRLMEALRMAGLGQVLDIVPNHMAINAPANPWWWDVLENGPSSRYVAYFDVDWNSHGVRPSNQVLIPILGDQYGRVLEAGEIQLEVLEDGGRPEAERSATARQPSLIIPSTPFVIRYYNNLYPASPRSVSSLLERAAEKAGSDTLAFLGQAFSHLPEATVSDRAGGGQRSRDEKLLYSLLRRLMEEEPEIRSAIQGVVTELNRDPDALDAFLSLQYYRLAFWRLASQELGYRRFFDVNSLIGLRMEDEQVFQDTHALILGWLKAGLADGLRVDHPDGLRDPQGYLERLRAAGPETWIVVEKILEPGEELRSDWPVNGTTGYDFMRRANGLFIDPQSQGPLTSLYEEFTGLSTRWETLVLEKKRQAMEEILGSEVNRLVFLWMQICERHRRYRDFSQKELRDALIETAACLPVYRTYVRAEAGEIEAADREVIREAIEAAKIGRRDLDSTLFDFLLDLLLLRKVGDLESELAMRFQQLSGPAMAKGVEDTAFYNFYRLISLNEVGGSPGQFGVSPSEFHRACQVAQQSWGKTMLSTSTHDTKRSEDVRARLNLLSEIPEKWAQAVRRWSQMNEKHRSDSSPDRNDEYLLYQTLFGAWPISLERIQRYMEKAVRESKSHTSWTAPIPEYEEAVSRFVGGVMADPAFLDDFQAFITPLVEPGSINALAQALLKFTAPGIPDLYQGSELWTDSLVDPDNRRPVDYELRRRMLAELTEDTSPEQVMERMAEGLPKLWLTRQSLRLRARLPEAFRAGSSYRPLDVNLEDTLKRSLPGQDPAVAFVRGEEVVVVVPRLVLRRAETWPSTTVAIPGGTWLNELTGERVEGGPVTLERLLARFPVGLLSKLPV